MNANKENLGITPAISRCHRTRIVLSRELA